MPLSRKRLLGFASIIGAAVVLLSGCLREGVNVVGSGRTQAAPGLYTTTVPLGKKCFWYRLSATVSKPSTIIVGSYSLSGRVFARVLTTDKALQSIGCGTWFLAKPTSYNPNRVTAKAGDYRIPTDLLPGTYHSAGGKACYWKRVNAWTGINDVIIANAFGNGPQTVTIAKTDAGFSSRNCAPWTRVSP